MSRARLSLVLFLVGAAAFGDDAATVRGIVARLDPDTWDRYRGLNEAEGRLAEYRDTDEALALKLAELATVNTSRKRYGMGPVELDILASRVANRQAREAAENGFRGHWNLRGEKPYQRYAFAGGVDHVSENASATWTSGAFEQTFDTVLRFMAEAHDRFMAEKAPNDGHKQNIIEPEHTHVGLGFYLAAGRFAYYEEFLDRYLEFVAAPTTAKQGAEIQVAVRPLAAGLYPYAVITYYEPYPRPMTLAQVNAQGAYPDYTADQEHGIWPWDLKTGDDGITRIPLKLTRRGLYYVQIYLDTRPPPRSGGADTRGKIQASGLVVRVE